MHATARRRSGSRTASRCCCSTRRYPARTGSATQRRPTLPLRTSDGGFVIGVDFDEELLDDADSGWRSATSRACCGRSPPPVRRSGARSRPSATSGSNGCAVPRCRARCSWPPTPRRRPRSRLITRLSCTRTPALTWHGVELPRWAGAADALLIGSVDGRHPRLAELAAQGAQRGLAMAVVAPAGHRGGGRRGPGTVARTAPRPASARGAVVGADPAAAGAGRARRQPDPVRTARSRWPKRWTRRRRRASRTAMRSPIRRRPWRWSSPTRRPSSSVPARWRAWPRGRSPTRCSSSRGCRRCRCRCPTASAARVRCCAVPGRRRSATSSVTGSTNPSRPCGRGCSSSATTARPTTCSLGERSDAQIQLDEVAARRAAAALHDLAANLGLRSSSVDVPRR